MPLAWSQYICTSMYMMDKKVCCSRDTGKYLYFYSPQQYPGRAFRREVGERSGHNRVNQHHVKGFTGALHSVRGRAFIGFTGSLHTEGLHSQDSLAPYTQTQGLHSQDSLAPYTDKGTAFVGFTASLHRQRDCIHRIHWLPTVYIQGLNSLDSQASTWCLHGRFRNVILSYQIPTKLSPHRNLFRIFWN